LTEQIRPVSKSSISGSQEKSSRSEIEFVRLDNNHERIKVRQDDILFIEANDHYIKALVIANTEKIWVSRHCQLHQILELLKNRDFILLNRFYIINIMAIRDVKEEINQDKHLKQLVIFFDHKCKVNLIHGINQYVMRILIGSLFVKVISRK